MYNYRVTINGTVYDQLNKHIVSSSSLNISDPLCTTSKKSATGTVSFSLVPSRDSSYFKTFYDALVQERLTGRKIVVEILESGTYVFRGYLDTSSLTTQSKILPEKVSLSARSKITLLDEKAKLNHYFEGSTRYEIINWLLAELNCGLSISSSELPIAETVERWKIAEDDNLTFRNAIDTLLFEAISYVLYYDAPTDSLKIKKIADSIPTGTTPRIINYIAPDSLQTSAGIYDNDGILLSYPTYSEKANYNLYADSISPEIDAETGTIKGKEIKPGMYYPDDADITATYQEYTDEGLDRAYVSKQSRKKDDDIALLYAKDCSYSTICDKTLKEITSMPAIHYTGVKYYPNKAWVLLQYEGQTSDYKRCTSDMTTVDETETYYKLEGGVFVVVVPDPTDNPYANGWYTATGANLQAFSITGTAVYRSEVNKITCPELCINPEEIEVTTITDPAKAKLFAKWYYNTQKYSKLVSTWYETSDIEQKSVLGEVVNVKHKGSDIATASVIVQIDNVSATTYGRVRKYKVTAISIQGYESTVSTGESKTKPSSPVINKPSIIKTTEYFIASQSSTEIPVGATWVEGRKNVTNFNSTNKYLWKKVKYTYSDGTESESAMYVAEVYYLPNMDIPKYLGTVENIDELPIDPNVGDAILCVNDFTMSGSEVNFRAGYPYIFNGTEWEEQTNANADNASMLWAMIQDAQGLPNGTFSWFVNIVASNATIIEIFSNYIEIGEAIYGGNKYDKYGNEIEGSGAVKGFHLSKDGFLQASKAKLVDTVVSGTLKAVPLETVNKLPQIDSTSVKSPYDTQWDNVTSPSDGLGETAKFFSATDNNGLIVRRDANTLVGVYLYEVSSSSSSAKVYTSTDNGTTWTDVSTVAPYKGIVTVAEREDKDDGAHFYGMKSDGQGSLVFHVGYGRCVIFPDDYYFTEHLSNRCIYECFNANYIMSFNCMYADRYDKITHSKTYLKYASSLSEKCWTGIYNEANDVAVLLDHVDGELRMYRPSTNTCTSLSLGKTASTDQYNQDNHMDSEGNDIFVGLGKYLFRVDVTGGAFVSKKDITPTKVSGSELTMAVACNGNKLAYCDVAQGQFHISYDRGNTWNKITLADSSYYTNYLCKYRDGFAVFTSSKLGIYSDRCKMYFDKITTYFDYETSTSTTPRQIRSIATTGAVRKCYTEENILYLPRVVSSPCFSKIVDSYTPAVIYDFFKTVFDKVSDTWKAAAEALNINISTLPEPLSYEHAVTGTLTADNVTYNITKLKLSDNLITVTTSDNDTASFDKNTPSLYPFSMQNLVISETEEMVRVKDVIPFSDNTYSLGKQTIKFKDLWVNKLHADNLFNTSNLKFSTSYNLSAISDNDIGIYAGVPRIVTDTSSSTTYYTTYIKLPSGGSYAYAFVHNGGSDAYRNIGYSASTAGNTDIKVSNGSTATSGGGKVLFLYWRVS